MLTAAFQVGLRSTARFIGANAAMGPVHKRAVSTPHHKLVIVSVDPDLQGKGRGTALVRDGLERVDQDGLPCYLDTNTPANVPSYERLGFAVADVVPLGKDGPGAWGMPGKPTTPGST